MSDGRLRQDIRPGIEVSIVLKQDQRTGKLTRGIVKDILTNSVSYPHGTRYDLSMGRLGAYRKLRRSSRFKEERPMNEARRINVQLCFDDYHKKCSVLV